MSYQDKDLPLGSKITTNHNQMLSNNRWYYTTASQTRLKALADFKTWYFQQTKSRA